MADKKEEILLETGTNEFEIVEFGVGDVTYGINVAKVREVINRVPVTKLPNTHRYVDGVFTLRGKVIPLVNLRACLNLPADKDGQRIIVSELNNFYAGFLVDEVSRIHRISWTKMEPPPPVAQSDYVVGIIKFDNRMVVLLDFERILAEVNPEMNMVYAGVKAGAPVLLEKRQKKTVLIAEDSPLLRELLLGTLHEAGYQNVIVAKNGLEAWNILEKKAKESSSIYDDIQLVITDIEMPQMDGHHLTRRIRENERMSEMPILIFSSLINEENQRKGEHIGATAQVSKPQITELIDLVDKHIL